MAGSVTFGFYHPVLSRHLEFLGFHACILYTLLYLKQHALEKKLGRSQHLKCSNLTEENTSLILLSRELRTEWNYKILRISPLCSVCFLQVSTVYNIDWFIRRQVSLSFYLELSSNRRLNAACLFLVIFSLHITKFSIKFQRCTFSLENSWYLSSQSRWFRPCLPCTVPRYLSANLSTSQALKWFLS